MSASPVARKTDAATTRAIDPEALRDRAVAWLFDRYSGRHTRHDEDELTVLLLAVSEDAIDFCAANRAEPCLAASVLAVKGASSAPPAEGFSSRVVFARGPSDAIDFCAANRSSGSRCDEPLPASPRAPAEPALREAIGLLNDVDAVAPRIREFLNREVKR